MKDKFYSISDIVFSQSVKPSFLRQSFDKNSIMFYLGNFLKKVFAIVCVCDKVLGKGLLWRNELESVRFPPH